jgi:BirA family transcriptional regulator, biotin operon repressor / biotin---[acetyl-CoA-carboxylase] ligase
VPSEAQAGPRPVPDALSTQAIAAGLTTTFLGRNLLYRPETASTNDDARWLALHGAPAGMVVVADYQTRGRGRLDRRWHAPSGSSLLLSVILRPALEPRQVQQVTMICGLALVEAVATEVGLEAGLKWPNDLVVAGAKVAGILAEVGTSGDRLDYVIAGIGLNVNLAPEQLPGSLLTPATSLSRLAGRHVPRLPLLQTLLAALERRYLASEGACSPHSEWSARLVTVGQRVQVRRSGPFLEGIAIGVDDDGALLVRLADGSMEKVIAGDVLLQ